MSTSEVIGLEFIEEGQGQQEIVANEALVRLQVLACGFADSFTNTPPEDPTDMTTVIVGAAPDAGPFELRANTPAFWYEGAWRFIPDVTSLGAIIPMSPTQAGMRFYVRDTGTDWRWDGYGWIELP